MAKHLRGAGAQILIAVGVLDLALHVREPRVVAVMLYMGEDGEQRLACRGIERGRHFMRDLGSERLDLVDDLLDLRQRLLLSARGLGIGRLVDDDRRRRDEHCSGNRCGGGRRAHTSA